MDKNISLLFALTVVISAISTLVLDFLFYFRKKDGTLFKYVSILGVALVYSHAGHPLSTASILLQLASVIVYMIVLCGTTKISNRNNAEKLANIQKEQEKASNLLSDILRVVDVVKESSSKADIEMEGLGNDIEHTSYALNDISTGNFNNATNIEKQTVMTSKIQDMIFATKDMAHNMIETCFRIGNCGKKWKTGHG